MILFHVVVVNDINYAKNVTWFNFDVQRVVAGQGKATKALVDEVDVINFVTFLVDILRLAHEGVLETRADPSIEATWIIALSKERYPRKGCLMDLQSYKTLQFRWQL